VLQDFVHACLTLATFGALGLLHADKHAAQLLKTLIPMCKTEKYGHGFNYELQQNIRASGHSRLIELSCG
jgi:hypothetical protein